MIKLEQTLTSLEVAEMVGRRHDQVIRDIRNIIEQLADHKSVAGYFTEDFYEDKNGQQRPCYRLTKKGCELFSTRMTGAKGTQFAVAYIERFNQMEHYIEETQKEFEIPTTLSGALRLAANQAEQLEEQAPLVEFAKNLQISESSISVSDMAKLIQQKGVDMGQNRLFDWLRKNDYLVKRGSSKNMPTQKSMEMGLFEIKEGTYFKINGESAITKTTKVTTKGQEYFLNKFLKDGAA